MLDIISLIFTDHGHCINENDDLFSIDFGKFDKKTLEAVKKYF